MRFLEPSFLPLLWLALVPLVLYFFRRKSRTIRVSTLLFFKSLAREHKENPWLRRLKRLLSLLLTLIILGAPIMALGRLVLAPRGEAVRSVVIAFDRSASMAARDAGGRSRLEDARAQVRAQLDALPESVPVALLAFDARTEVLVAKSSNRRALIRALDELAVRPLEDDAASALAAAARIARLETPSELWLVSDRDIRSDRPANEGSTSARAGAPGGADAGSGISEDSGIHVRSINVSLASPVNAGITAFDLKKVPLLHARYQVYVQVALSAGSNGPQDVVVEPQVGGLPLARRELSLQPGATEGLTIDVDAPQEQRLTVSVGLPDDCLAPDNSVAARLPAPRPLVVAWFAAKPDPFTELALKSFAEDGELDVFAATPEHWPPARTPDVAIFDGWLPDAWPAGIPALVINPTGSSGPVRAVPLPQPVPRDTIRSLDDEHPVLFRVSTSRVALTQTAVVDASGPLQPLWLAADQAVLLAGEYNGQRLVVLPFAAALSEQLPLTPSFPVLLGNAIFWCAEKSRDVRSPRLFRTGSLVESSGGAVEWRELANGKLKDAVRVPAAGGMIELDRIGLWRTVDGDREGSSLLLSRHETNLTSTTAVAATAGEAPRTIGRFTLRGELTWLFLWLVALALVLESWLFHRHAVG
jgi:hypothetical protein